MQVILLQDVKALGKKGEMVKVSEGYARNYLIPKNLAQPANAGNINNMKTQKAAKDFHKAEEKAAAEAYGEESAQRALLLTEDRRMLKEGTGVALEAEGECVFRIAAPPERWSTHQRAILKSI